MPRPARILVPSLPLLLLLLWVPSGASAQRLGSPASLLGDPWTGAPADPASAGAASAGAASAGAASTGAGSEARGPQGFALDLALGTTAPLDLSVSVSAELPGRLLASAELGWVAPFYRDGAVSLASDLAGRAMMQDDRATFSALAGDILSFRLSVGWRPFESEGLELGLGYLYLGSSGAAPTRDAARALTGVDHPLGGRLALNAEIHAIRASVGWRWLLADDHLVIRARLGWAHALDASARLGGSGRDELPADQPATLETKIAEALVRYGMSPELSLSIGYRF